MNKIYKSVDEMINDNEDDNKKALRELNKSIIESKKQNKQKLIRLIILVISIFSLFKIFIGEINLILPARYNYRLYDVTLNEELISNCVTEYRRYPIIPFIINNVSDDLYCYHHADGRKTIPFNKGDKIYITINSFECFNSINNGKKSCYPYRNQGKKEVNDTKYSLIIQRVGGGEKLIYDGEFINDITSYFSEKGVYDINMVAKYKNVKSVISFSVRIID